MDRFSGSQFARMMRRKADKGKRINDVTCINRGKRAFNAAWSLSHTKSIEVRFQWVCGELVTD